MYHYFENWLLKAELILLLLNLFLLKVLFKYYLCILKIFINEIRNLINLVLIIKLIFLISNLNYLLKDNHDFFEIY